MQPTDVLVVLDGRLGATNIAKVTKEFDPSESLSGSTKDIYCIHAENPATDRGEMEICRIVAAQTLGTPAADEKNLTHGGSLRSNVLSGVQPPSEHDYWNIKGQRVRHWPTPPALCEELIHRVGKVAKVKGILDLFAVDGTLGAAAVKAGVPYVRGSVGEGASWSSRSRAVLGRCRVVHVGFHSMFP